MKNITLKIDDVTYRKARLKAAEAGTSVSAMVRDFLIRETSAEDDREARRIASLEKLFKLAETRGAARAEPLVPLTREEIYAERLR
jgi:plasmid stability protein